MLGIGAQRLLKLAVSSSPPSRARPQVSIAHIHQVRVSVREHAGLLRERLRRAGSATFRLLVADCDNTLEVVARFLALLELYREGLVEFEQPVSLEELTVRWTGSASGDLEISDEFTTTSSRDAASRTSSSAGWPPGGRGAGHLPGQSVRPQTTRRSWCVRLHPAARRPRRYTVDWVT